MAKIDITKLAEIVGATDDLAFEQLANSAVAELERQLGYALCGTIEAEERLFDWSNSSTWHRTHPMYETPTQIILVRGDDTEETIIDFQLGQNGKLHGSWFNAFKLCDLCQSRCGLNCIGCDNCVYAKVTAKWGFGAPQIIDESGGDDSTVCYLPDDLYNVLVEAVKQANNPASDIQSEGTGTRNYTKFAKSYMTAWEKYASVIDFYKMREPRI